jgi:hypothetical protein
MWQCATPPPPLLSPPHNHSTLHSIPPSPTRKNKTSTTTGGFSTKNVFDGQPLWSLSPKNKNLSVKYFCRQGLATITVMPTNGITVQIKKILKLNNTPLSASFWITLQLTNVSTTTQGLSIFRMYFLWETLMTPPPRPPPTWTSVFF